MLENPYAEVAAGIYDQSRRWHRNVIQRPASSSLLFAIGNCYFTGFWLTGRISTVNLLLPGPGSGNRNRAQTHGDIEIE